MRTATVLNTVVTYEGKNYLRGEHITATDYAVEEWVKRGLVADTDTPYKEEAVVPVEAVASVEVVDTDTDDDGDDDTQETPKRSRRKKNEPVL